MQVKMESNKPTIVIIGAGAAGFSAALELAEKGYQVELLEKDTLGSGASGRNPGRMGHGFHYTDLETAKAYLHASILVQKTHPGYLVGQELPFNASLRHGRYFITKDSNPPKDKILETYEAIKEEYKRLCKLDPNNEVFGPPDEFFRILDPSEYKDVVNMDIVDIGVETAEHLFNWQHFAADIRTKIINHPNITLREQTEVTLISRNELGEPRFTVEAKTKGESLSFKTDYIVNSTWQEIKRLNDHIGLKMIPGERTNRLKTLILLELPESLKHSHSMFFCMGQHCMISNLGNGKAMATFASVTNMEVSTGLSMSANAERLLRGEATVEEKENIAQQMIKGISNYIPEIANARAIDLKFGIVQTEGNLTLSDLKDPAHAFHKRDDHCVRTEQIGFISNPCMKLFYFVENGQMVTNLIQEHRETTQVIYQCMALIKEKAALEGVKFDKRIQRLVLENLERYEAPKLKLENIEDLTNTIIATLKAKSASCSFFTTKPSIQNKGPDSTSTPNNFKY